MIELGVALTALSAISSAVSQGKELFEVGSQLDTFFNDTATTEIYTE